MSVWRPLIHEVCPRVYRVESPYTAGMLTMIYVIRGEKLTLVDTGAVASPVEDLKPALAEIGIDLSEVGYVLNTHGHSDHLGGNPSVRDAAPEAKIHLHRADRPFADSHDHHRTFNTEFLRAFGREDLIEERIAYTLELLGRDVGVDRVLEDGDRIDLGGGVELTVVHTPGHTPGSVSYYWEAEKLLLTGDSVQARGFKPGGYPLYFDAQAYGRSMQRLKDLPIETIGMGHGFISGMHLNAPVKYGDEARHMVEESALVHATIDRTVRKLAAELPEASLLELAQRTTMELIGALPTHVDPRIGLPLSGGPTLWSHASVARAAAAS